MRLPHTVSQYGLADDRRWRWLGVQMTDGELLSGSSLRDSPTPRPTGNRRAVFPRIRRSVRGTHRRPFFALWSSLQVMVQYVSQCASQVMHGDLSTHLELTYPA